MADVFLAYSHRNSRKADMFEAALKAQRLSVFRDTAIGVGARWDIAIEAELRSAKAVLTLWSQTSINSDYVREEARSAKEMNKLVPVKITKCDIPYGFKTVQTADMTRWRGNDDDPTWKGVVQAIQLLRHPRLAGLI